MDPAATVGDLRRALTEHVASRDLPPPAGASLWTSDARALDDEHLVAGRGLRSGARLWLSNRPPPGAGAAHQPAGAADAVDAGGRVAFTPVPVPASAGRRDPMPRRPDPPGRLAPGRRRYRAELARYAAALDRWLEAEWDERTRALPAVDELVEAARTRRPPLWSRTRDGADLLTVRLGTTDLRPDPQVHGDLRVEVPLALDLEETVNVGFHGDAGVVDGLVRSVVGQVVAHHRPDDVVVAALLAPSALRSFEWLRWLPHVRSSASPLAGDHLAAWPEAIGDVAASLLDLEPGRSWPRVVVLVHEDADLDADTLDQLLAGAGDRGIRVLWIGRDEEAVPARCTPVAAPAAVEGAGVATVDALARHLAPLRDASSVARVSSMPRFVGLTEVLGGTPAPADIASAWSVSDVGFLDAPVGTGADGPFSVDLVEQGPHAVITGAPGSGTTGLLRTWIAVLAARHPPERLALLFTDHRGEAASSFAGLPHDVGVVADLDARLRVELDRRTTLLAGRDLTELAATDPSSCPPRLVVVVEDFDGSRPGLADVAESGGDLGVHLVVAGHLAAEIDEELLACIDLRIALRVDDRARSERLLGAGDAADIPPTLPGRAFAWLGAASIEPFQAAWSGAPRGSGGPNRVRVEALGFGRSGDREEPAGEPGATSQLEVVLAAVRLAFERSGRRPPRPPGQSGEPE